MSYLFLWDIDGTLLHNPGSGGSLKEPLAAVREVSGQRELSRPNRIDGSTDWKILSEIVENSGLPRSLVPLALRALEERTTDQEYITSSRRPLPGVPFVLRRLMPFGIQTYATGNSARRALAKAQAFGIDSFLRPEIGGFGDRAENREDFLFAAVASAKELYGDLRPVVLGDTPHDISAARAIGALAVAVAGGVYGKKELSEHKPDLLLGDWEGDDLFYFLQ